MNERLVMRLTQEGVPIRFRELSWQGVGIDRDRDVWLRELTLEFGADSPITHLRVDHVRQIKGWEGNDYELALSIEDGALVAKGVDPAGLPAGRYWIKPYIGDLLSPAEGIRFELKENGEAQLEVEVKPENRSVEILPEILEADPFTVRLLSNDQSRLDDLLIREWLRDPRPRPSRKACFLNLLAKLRITPDANRPILAQVQRVLSADVDRCYAIVDRTLLDRLKQIFSELCAPFPVEGLPPNQTYRKLSQLIRDAEPDADSFLLHSFQRNEENDLQSVLAIPPGEDLSRPIYAEFSLAPQVFSEEFNGLFVFLGESPSPRRTDHLSLWRTLAGDPSIAPYLGYRVV
jgi:hypothetical protein